MTATLVATRRSTGARPRPGRAVVALAVLDLRLVARGAIALITIMAGLTAVVVLQYATTFASPDNVRSLEALVGNPAIRVLFGVPRALDQSGGFTVWRIGTFAAVAAAAWALATATRLTRGQEDTGRAWLTLVGPLRLRSALLAHLLVIAAASILLGVATGLAMVAAGAGSRGAVVYATGITLVGLLFAAVGAASGQLLGERRIATGLSAGLLLVGLLVRMVADGIEWLGWTAWLTPFGLLSLSAPYAGDRSAPLGVLAGMAVVVGVVAWMLAGRRDVGSGLLADRQERRPRLRLLSSGWGFAVRRTWPAFVGWSLALGCVLPADRAAGDFVDRVPRGQPPVRRAGRCRRVHRPGDRAGLRRLPAVAAARAAGAVRGHPGGRPGPGRSGRPDPAAPQPPGRPHRLGRAARRRDRGGHAWA